MAKKQKEVEVAETENAGGASRGKKVMITHVETGVEEARVDVIKRLWNDGQGTDETKDAKSLRGAIVKILETQYNHKIPYQIVFAATKPAKAAEGTEAPAAEAGESNEAEAA